MEQAENKKLNIWQKLLGVVLGVVLGYVFFKFALPWLMPFFLALTLARLLEPLIQYTQRRTKIKRQIIVVVFLSLSFTILSSIIYLVLSYFVREILDFIRVLPDYINKFPAILDVFRQKFEEIVSFLPYDISKWLLSSWDKIIGSINISQETVRTLFTRLGTFAVSLPNALIFIITLFVASFLISFDYEKVTKFLVLQIPQKWRQRFYRTKEHLINTVWKWLKAISILLIITFVELFIGMIILDVDHPIFVAAIIALVDMLPILGVGTVLIPWAIYEFIIGNITRAVTVLILYAIINLVRNITEPKIVGSQIGLPPIVMLISVYIGLKTLGIIGMFLIPIIMITLLKFQEWGYIKLFKFPTDNKDYES